MPLHPRGAERAPSIVCSSVNVGVHQDRHQHGRRRAAWARWSRTPPRAPHDNDCYGCAKLVVFCNAPDDNPFMAGAFHGAGRGRLRSSTWASPAPAWCLARSSAAVRAADFESCARPSSSTAFKITRVGQLVAHEASRRLGVPFGIVDLSLAPTPAVGDSVARILEEIGVEQLRWPRHHRAPWPCSTTR